MDPQNRPSEVTITFRIPSDLKQQIQEKIKGRYSTLSEFIRCKIREDIDGDARLTPPSETAETD